MKLGAERAVHVSGGGSSSLASMGVGKGGFHKGLRHIKDCVFGFHEIKSEL